MTPNRFLVLNLALAFYNVGTIWAHEIDLFRTWKLVGASEFRAVQRTHFRKLPYWIFLPVLLAIVGGIVLLRYQPIGSPRWCARVALGLQLLSAVLTAAMWGQWQARLAKDPLGPASPYLDRILRTHWVRTLLINAYAAVLLYWVLQQG